MARRRVRRGVLSDLDVAGSQGERLAAAYVSLAAAGIVGDREFQAVELWRAAVGVDAPTDKGLETLHPQSLQTGENRE
jgi:hypothetical protein